MTTNVAQSFYPSTESLKSVTQRWRPSLPSAGDKEGSVQTKSWESLALESVDYRDECGSVESRVICLPDATVEMDAAEKKQFKVDMDAAAAARQKKEPQEMASREFVQKKAVDVWKLASLVPRGRVSTYSELARVLGEPWEPRAVGQALKRNPCAVTIPCHRIVRADRSLGGYFGASNLADHKMQMKISILKEEGVQFEACGHYNNSIRVLDSCMWRFPFKEVDLHSIRLPLQKNAVEDPREACEFIVAIDKRGGGLLGIDIDHGSGVDLHIDAVQGDGLVGEWNTSHPGLQVGSGDRIIEVNGLRGDSKKMMKRARTHERLMLLVRQGSWRNCRIDLQAEYA